MNHSDWIRHVAFISFLYFLVPIGLAGHEPISTDPYIGIVGVSLVLKGIGSEDEAISLIRAAAPILFKRGIPVGPPVLSTAVVALVLTFTPVALPGSMNETHNAGLVSAHAIRSVWVANSLRRTRVEAIIFDDHSVWISKAKSSRKARMKTAVDLVESFGSDIVKQRERNSA